VKQKKITHSCVPETIPRRPSGARYRSELSPGTVIDNRYELLTFLGKGGMSEVFEAIHLTLREPRALKVLPRSAGDDDVAVERFQREARTTVKLKHPNIVEMSDAGVSEEGHRYLVMELLRGETMADWLSHIPLSDRREGFIRELILLLLDVLKGLGAAHEQGVLHRDLKPSNIFLHRNENDEIVPKILDFGIARDLGIGESKLTVAGQITGSIAYVSPERLEENEFDYRSDLYSLGVILYEALSGATPTGETSRAMVIVRSVDANFRIIPPSRHNPHVPRYLDRITLKALSRNPDGRYASADELSEVLAALPILHPAIPGEEIKPDNARHRGRRTAVGITIALLLLAVAAVVAADRWGLLDTVLPSALRELSPNAPPAPPISAAMPVAEPSAPLPAEEPVAEPPPPPPEEPVTEPVLPEPTAEEPAQEDSQTASPPPKSPPSRGHRRSENHSQKPSQEGNAEALVKDGYTELGNMNYRTAESLFQKAIDLNPRSARAWFGLSKVAFEKRDYGTALTRVNRALGYQDRARWRIFRGEIRLAKRDRAGAIWEWQQVIDRFPEDKLAKKVAIGHLQKAGASPGK
jgi:serine/threonine protein kinase